MGYLEAALFELRRTKRLGERALEQIAEEDWRWRPDEDANSIAVIVQHLHGNMRSRWTDFLEADGEKEWRRRDEEFVPQGHPLERLWALWEEGWGCCLGALEALGDADLDRTVTIRGEPLTVLEAVLRQVSHYSYHVGQIVYLARARCCPAWRSLSIPRGRSAEHGTGTYKRE